MEGNTNTYREVDIADRLIEIKQELAKKKVDANAQKKILNAGSFTLPEEVEIVDVVEINPYKFTLPDEVQLNDDVTVTSASTFSFNNSAGTGGSPNAKWSYNSFVDSTGAY